jgi:serine/threonine-protein kinase
MAFPLERMQSHESLGAHDPYALVGEVVSGRFRVLSVKHSGPRGVVYEVEPPGVGQLRRALKVITVAEAREPDVAERLRTVIRALRDADHPHVERVFDVGHLPDESPFVVAEWLPQVSLERVLGGRRRLPTETSLEILLQTVRGCAALHARGVVHGDLRPSHVLIEMAGEEPSDLRVLKLVDAGVPGVLNMGLVGGAAGQVAYLSPECLAGQPRSPASDVYALGVLAYRLLTQHLPYRPEDPRVNRADRDPVSRVRWLHQNASPVRPSRLVPQATLSPELEAVIGRAMAKSTVERYADAAALLISLENALRAPTPRVPGSVAQPLSEELPTEGTAPEAVVAAMPADEVEPADEDIDADAPATVAGPSATAPADVNAADAEAAALDPLPDAPPATPLYWACALAGVATGILWALL